MTPTQVRRARRVLTAAVHREGRCRVAVRHRWVRGLVGRCSRCGQVSVGAL